MKPVLVVAILSALAIDRSPAALNPEIVQKSTIVSQSVSVISHINGKQLVSEIRDTELEDSPPWQHPESEGPPLSIADAVLIARPRVANYVPDPDRWLLHAIQIQSLGTTRKWYYRIAWRPSGGYVGDDLSIVVLMTGQPVSPRVTEEAKR